MTTTVNSRILKSLLPNDEIMKIKLNGKDTETPGGYTIADLLKMRDLLGKPLVAELNGTIVKKDLYDETKLTEGDALEIVRLVGGG